MTDDARIAEKAREVEARAIGREIACAVIGSEIARGHAQALTVENTVARLQEGERQAVREIAPLLDRLDAALRDRQRLVGVLEYLRQSRSLDFFLKEVVARGLAAEEPRDAD